jgi:hypothetical protein
MKKLFLSILMTTILAVPGVVNAAVDVANETELENAIKNGETEINLTGDITLTTNEDEKRLQKFLYDKKLED